MYMPAMCIPTICILLMGGPSPVSVGVRARRRKSSAVMGPVAQAAVTEFLGASLAIYGGVSPSRLSPGVARRSKGPGLSVDVLLDDRQRGAWAGDGEVGQEPEVSAHEGADTGAGEFATHCVWLAASSRR